MNAKPFVNPFENAGRIYKCVVFRCDTCGRQWIALLADKQESKRAPEKAEAHVCKAKAIAKRQKAYDRLVARLTEKHYRAAENSRRSADRVERSAFREATRRATPKR